MRDVLRQLEESLSIAIERTDLPTAMAIALEKDPVRVIEALAKLKALGVLERGAGDMSDSELQKAAEDMGIVV